ncbi:T9SS type A sorting domain-containing protein [Hymenobacter sp. BT683]|uniref:T9SS type A sorting domain-containing protein n=1 Tax=Hymenobacter jeongseonensis TaxID=2791027 RepID=A0ABS0IG27_9BACT|nr:IPT/TIG domain-containing protein [Hymenobacter jeongseonensis]MBF9237309.1 T9SS type A sorting domain-containing protein [Hymenobacter jeongseonensis]
MKHFFTTRLLACLVALLMLWPAAIQAQNITQTDFTGVIVPQFVSGGNNSTSNPGTRLPYVFRATLTNLTASTTYRYFVTASIATDLTGTGGAGVILSLTPGTDAASTVYATSSTGSLGTEGSYASFTTDAAGTYTGWFGYVNSGNARFSTPGNVLFPMITLATDAAPATIVARRALDLGATVVLFGNAATGNGTMVNGASSATPKNLVFTYDNTTGAGRPLSGGLVESVGVTTGTTGGTATSGTYNTTNGAYNLVIPNALSTGVRRVEERSVVTGSVLNCNTDADGTWPSGANTANPTGGITPILLTATDTPLNAGCSTAPAATVTATPATLNAFTAVVGTPSATQTVTVGGSTLTADVVVTAPTGYEVSLSATTDFAASVTIAQAAGTAASTPVYVRLTGTTVGAFAGNVTVASTGATTANVAVVGTVTAVATPTPTITSFTPATGPVGTSVTVTGTNFTGATGATLNGTAVTNFMVMSATSVMFDVPAGATSGTIVVTTPGGTATSTASFTVTAPVVTPVISALSPNAQVAGGPDVTLTITGTGFTPSSTVNFNGVSYTQTSSTATTLVVTIPASALTTAGSYTVSVSNAGATSTAFTFIVSNPSTAGAFENFETGVKGGYAADTVFLTSGNWNFSNSLIGSSFADKFNGLKSARIRTGGFIAMYFDKPNGAGVVTINAALYGADAAATFALEMSADGGTTYTVVPGAPAALTATLTPYTFTVNQTGAVRFRISHSVTATTGAAAPRIIIDDLIITDFTATATNASKAMPGLTVSPNPATDRITVALPKAGAATVALRDLTGRLVVAPAALAADQQMLLPARLAAGVYLLEVRQGAVTAVRRVQKN